MNVDHLPGDVTVPSFGPRMVCTRCGTIGADVRPSRMVWLARPDMCAVPADAPAGFLRAIRGTWLRSGVKGRGSPSVQQGGRGTQTAVAALDFSRA
jgi:hypothetical protein